MLSPQALVRGIVQRALPSFLNPDNTNNDVAFRQFTYGEMATQPLVRKAHNLADEGSYFVGQMGTSAQTALIGTAFSGTAPLCLIQNQTPNSRLYLDYIANSVVTASTSTTTCTARAIAVVTDVGLRYSSGGVAMTLNCPNMAVANPTGISAWSFGSSLAATAASGSARTIISERIARPVASTTVINVAGDMNLFNFGSVEGAAGTVAVANANIMPQALPPIIIGPNQSALFYLWLLTNGTPVAGTELLEIGFWVR